MSRKLTTEEVITRFRIVHGDEFDYSLVDYDGMKKNVRIICSKGHIFEQTPESHLRGSGCNICANNQPKSNDRFLDEAREIWGDIYDLSPVKYRNWRTRVTIGCAKHGLVSVIPNDFLRGSGCPKCGIEARNASKVKSKEDFVAQANVVHYGYYNYDDSDYKGCYEPILIGCPKGHSFWQTPTKHLIGHGCTICNASHGETLIRQWLISRNIDFNEQYRVKPIQVLFGRNTFIVDFFIPSLNTIIEYHGEQHYSKNKLFHKDEDAFQEQLDRDVRLREYCKLNKMRLIEIPYTEIKDIEKILIKKIGVLN